jgi:hypothetical protein
MSQFDFGTIDPNVKTGTQLAADLNQWRTALHSTHAGAARPPYATPGMLWVDQVSSTDWRLKMATATGDVIIGGMNPTTNIGIPQPFPDGTIAAPGITWANEPTMGIIRSAAGSMQMIVSGVGVLGVTATALATGTGIATTLNGPANVTGTLTANGFNRLNGMYSTGTQVPDVPGVGVWNDSVEFCSGSSNIFGPIRLKSTSNLRGLGVVTPYAWVPIGAGSSNGDHTFGNLSGGACLLVQGGAYDGGNAGASLKTFHQTLGTVYAGIDLVETATNTGSIRFTINRTGSFNTAGDMSIRRVASGHPQVRILGNWAGSIALNDQAPLLLEGVSGGQPSIGFLEPGIVSWSIHTQTGGMYWGRSSANGPAGGWDMYLTGGTGQLTVGSVNPVSDRSLKQNIRSLGPSLDKVLRLHGIRYFNPFSQREDIGLVAQDVEPEFPELVFNNEPAPLEADQPSRKFASLNYMALAAPIIEAIRELDTRLKTLEGAPA